jgi:hypothetical protein
MAGRHKGFIASAAETIQSPPPRGGGGGGDALLSADDAALLNDDSSVLTVLTTGERGLLFSTVTAGDPLADDDASFG